MTITINGRVSGTCLNLWLTVTLTFQESKEFTDSVFEELRDRRSQICNNIILLGCLSLKIILKTVINILRDRFGKPQLLISYHMVALLKLAIVSSMHGMKKLCDLYDNSEINIQRLKALGIESESFGNLLVPVDNSSCMMALKYCNARKRNVGCGFWRNGISLLLVVMLLSEQTTSHVRQSQRNVLTGHQGTWKVCCLEVWLMT